MDLRYGKEYEDFRQEVRAFLAKHGHKSPSLQGEMGRPTAQAREWQALLIEQGYAARTIPRQYGGYGGEPDVLKSVIIDQEFDQAGVSKGLSGQGISMLVPTLLELGTEEQKQRWIRPTITGEIFWCQGYSEPNAGSDLASLQTRAHVEGDEFVINGQKIWTSSAHFSDMMIVLVRTEADAPKHMGISYLLLPMTTPGIEVRPLVTMTGDATFNEVFFTDVRLKTDQIVARRGDGWMVANATLKHERGMLGDPSQSANLLHQVTELLTSETVDGVRLIDSPLYRDRLMRLQARVASMQWHSMRLLTNTLKNELELMPILVVKLIGTHLNQDICALAIDALGELGILYDQSKYLRAMGMWQSRYMFSLGLIIGGGTSHIQKNIISERGLGMPREPKAVSA